MITIEDIPTNGQEHWKVDDSTGKLTGDMPYIIDDIGYDRLRVLQEIVELYSVLSGCKKQGWQPGNIGKIYILQ
jgi:hypothetical protein